ncbi:UvrD-helicase domain-containing protein [Cellulomonas sp. 179-A 9B4 NHS]|uniref:UvrD-helicase domain-containing protein n=1 Tax=Cellulomonas sp. 179-A 9B4 NHS TaxID=3142379 RepID=UPI0039A340B6
MAAVSVPVLDLSQQAAAEVEPGQRQVVVAGPGSGKTEVVSALVAHLVGVEEVDPEFSLLVVSFSRAAVHAVTRRLRANEIQAAAAVRTIDSLAQQIVREAYDEEIVGHDIFDRRIARATHAIRSGDWREIHELEHVVVDEVQDVVGLRAEFLLALMEGLPGQTGFTLLGDPAQAIYDFQLTADHPLTSGELLRRVGDMPGAVRRELTGSYRAGTRDASAAVALRYAGDPSLRGAEEDVRDFVVDIATVDDLGIAALARRQGNGLAVLTATNGQALMEAQDLWAAGVPVHVRRPLTAPVVDRWVAEMLATTPVWTFDDVLAVADDEAQAVERWRGLRNWIAPGSRTLETREVARRLRRGHVPGELVASEPDVAVVSTVHRAKGLEFDTVVLAEYERVADESREPAQQARVDYVAVTRARFRLLRVRRSRYPQILSRHPSTGRWLRSQWKTKKVRAVEVRGDDLDRTRPPGIDAERTQLHLRDHVRTGDSVQLVHDWTSGDTPFWDVHHKGVPIGRTKAEFGEAVRRILHGDVRMDLRGVHVECVETVAGDPVEDLQGGVGRHGLWLAPRLVGLAVRERKDEE